MNSDRINGENRVLFLRGKEVLFFFLLLSPKYGIVSEPATRICIVNCVVDSAWV
jgi:hypothetical protein